jgi:hypothetical protein
MGERARRGFADRGIETPKKKEGKRPGLNQNHFPGCVLEVFDYLDAEDSGKVTSLFSGRIDLLYKSVE